MRNVKVLSSIFAVLGLFAAAGNADAACLDTLSLQIRSNAKDVVVAYAQQSPPVVGKIYTLTTTGELYRSELQGGSWVTALVTTGVAEIGGGTGFSNNKLYVARNGSYQSPYRLERWDSVGANGNYTTLSVLGYRQTTAICTYAGTAADPGHFTSVPDGKTIFYNGGQVWPLPTIMKGDMLECPDSYHAILDYGDPSRRIAMRYNQYVSEYIQDGSGNQIGNVDSFAGGWVSNGRVELLYVHSSARSRIFVWRSGSPINSIGYRGTTSELVFSSGYRTVQRMIGGTAAGGAYIHVGPTGYRYYREFTCN